MNLDENDLIVFFHVVVMPPLGLFTCRYETWCHVEYSSSPPPHYDGDLPAPDTAPSYSTPFAHMQGAAAAWQIVVLQGTLGIWVGPKWDSLC